MISAIRYTAESPVKHLIHVVSPRNTTWVPGYTTVSVDIQHVFVATLGVAVGTQLKQLCLWIYDIQHVSLDTQMTL